MNTISRNSCPVASDWSNRWELIVTAAPALRFWSYPRLSVRIRSVRMPVRAPYVLTSTPVRRYVTYTYLRTARRSIDVRTFHLSTYAPGDKSVPVVFRGCSLKFKCCTLIPQLTSCPVLVERVDRSSSAPQNPFLTSSSAAQCKCSGHSVSFISSVQTTSMVYSDYVKQRILFYRRLGKSYGDVSLCLFEEGHKASKLGVYKFLKRYQERWW